MRRALPMLADGPKTQKVWLFSYHQLRTVFIQATTSLGLECMTLYQTRHSWPSIDGMGVHRSLLECKARGFWKAESSLQRYEKSSRLAADFLVLPATVRKKIEQLAPSAEGLVLGRG